MNVNSVKRMDTSLKSESGFLGSSSFGRCFFILADRYGKDPAMEVSEVEA